MNVLGMNPRAPLALPTGFLFFSFWEGRGYASPYFIMSKARLKNPTSYCAFQELVGSYGISIMAVLLGPSKLTVKLQGGHTRHLWSD